MILLALLLAADTGAIAGKVTLAGLAPKLANLPVTRDLKICGTSKPDESLEVGSGGGVKNVVISVVDVPAPKKPPAAKQKLDQQACVFVESFFSSSTMAETAVSMPRLSDMGLCPAATRRRPSL